MIRNPTDHAYELVRFAGRDGITTQELATNMKTEYHTARRYLKKLESTNLVVGEFRGLSGNTKVYVAQSMRVMPTVPHYNIDQPEIYLSNLVRALCTPPDSQMTVKLTKRMGLYISRLATIAAAWHNGDSVSMEELADLRLSMERAQVRAMWQVRVYDTLLKNEAIWSKKKAGTAWFNDPEQSFSVEEAQKLYTAFAAMLNDEEMQADG